MHKSVSVIVSWGCLLTSSAALAQECGSLDNAYGPYDYSNPQHRAELLPIVEGAHFDQNVRNLKGAVYRNKGDERVPGDIDYTLRAFPNHHVALDAMGRYFLLHRNESLTVGRYTPECWFERAMRFKPDDGVVRVVYGIFLYRQGKLQPALEMYKQALELAPESAEAHYNIGLLYLDLGQLDLATSHASRAYELGFPLPGLRRKLASVGRNLDGAAASLEAP
jgi:tetratricopeptide (TPR) repeat protein